jgi:tRNA A37 threonylcarbamoyladenosine synthetase subunit TsaC/SUA5/YrdC
MTTNLDKMIARINYGRLYVHVALSDIELINQIIKIQTEALTETWPGEYGAVVNAKNKKTLDAIEALCQAKGEV